jgi:hypothetical protein
MIAVVFLFHSHTQLSYGILCHMQHSWHPLWTNLNHWPKAITT